MNYISNYKQINDHVSYQRVLLAQSTNKKDKPLLSAWSNTSANREKMESLVKDFLAYGKEKGFIRSQCDRERAEALLARLKIEPESRWKSTARGVGALIAAVLATGVAYKAYTFLNSDESAAHLALSKVNFDEPKIFAYDPNLPVEVPSHESVKTIYDNIAKAKAANGIDDAWCTDPQQQKINKIFENELGKLYIGPIKDPNRMQAYLPQNNRILPISDKEKAVLFVAKSGVPIVVMHKDCYQGECNEFIPYEAVHNALETTDMIMQSVEPHVRKRVLDTRLYIKIVDPARETNLGDYSGWFRTAMRKDLNDNLIYISPNSLLPKIRLCELTSSHHHLKPATAYLNTLVHEFTHAVQALLPYRATDDSPLVNWDSIVDFPYRIHHAIMAQIRSLGLDPNREDHVNGWVSKTSSINGLSPEHVLLAKDIVFNRGVKRAYEAALLNPKYQEPINPEVFHGDYQMQISPGESVKEHYWIGAGTEYFAELVAGAFGMNKGYAFPGKGKEAFSGRMASPKWIQDNDPLGWELINSKFSKLEELYSRFCTLPSLDTMPYCRT